MAGTTPFKNDKKNELSWVPILAKVLGWAGIVLPILGGLTKEIAWSAGTFVVIGIGIALLAFGYLTKIGKGGMYIGNDVDTSQIQQ